MKNKRCCIGMNGIFRVMRQSPLNKYVKAWKESNLFFSLRCNAGSFFSFILVTFCVVNPCAHCVAFTKTDSCYTVSPATKHKCVYLGIMYVLRRILFCLWFKLNSLKQIKYKSRVVFFLHFLLTRQCVVQLHVSLRSIRVEFKLVKSGGDGSECGIWPFKYLCRLWAKRRANSVKSLGSCQKWNTWSRRWL